MNFKKFAVTGLSAAALIVGAASAATAAGSWQDGGWWEHGADAKWVWSEYQHNQKCHSSAVDGANGVKGSGNKRPGDLAAVRDEAALFGNEAFWNSQAPCP
ncbi:lactococcin 972 family bacteriocin [Kibdelosporangium aridum]|uniref:Bacteriocin, lactococcin 972 family n=1 Tax=Kibdelosporangium aridum TaxID=2030 RepID=A0A1W2DRZ2_KIBAR|nr:lactococcin 972 family bacteriocin [Kibdelosporangium aridum]SMC99812.1 bacteriocin, lactococcin 972 family [Kibdelosporangium aridum]